MVICVYLEKSPGRVTNSEHSWPHWGVWSQHMIRKKPWRKNENIFEILIRSHFDQFVSRTRTPRVLSETGYGEFWFADLLILFANLTTGLCGIPFISRMQNRDLALLFAYPAILFLVLMAKLGWESPWVWEPSLRCQIQSIYVWFRWSVLCVLKQITFTLMLVRRVSSCAHWPSR